jgi:hypothetical protein
MSSQQYFYGGVGVSIDHSVGLKAIGFIPNWSADIRTLKERVDFHAEEDCGGYPDGLPIFDCLLGEVATTTLGVEFPGREGWSDTWVTVLVDLEGCETYVFISDTLGVDYVGNETHTKKLPSAEEVAALEPLGSVAIFVGSMTDKVSSRLEVHYGSLERRLLKIEAVARTMYPKVMEELLAGSR